jgi:cytochrome c
LNENTVAALTGRPGIPKRRRRRTGSRNMVADKMGRVQNGGLVVRSYLIASAMLVGLVTSAHAQDAAAGEKDFLVCKACHQIGPNAKNAVGPVLNGVVGRKAGTFAGYNYSTANKDSGITWTADELDKYLTNPQATVPHTKMIFPGLKDAQKRKDVIAYLSSFNEDGSKKN